VLTDPHGRRVGQLAMLGDLNVAEPRALIVSRAARDRADRPQTLPRFQRSEFLLEHGAVDMIVDRRELRSRLRRCCAC